MVNRVFSARDEPPRSRLERRWLGTDPGRLLAVPAGVHPVGRSRFPLSRAIRPVFTVPAASSARNSLGRLNASRTTVVPSEAGPKSSCSPSPVNGGSFSSLKTPTPRPATCRTGRWCYRHDQENHAIRKNAAWDLLGEPVNTHVTDTDRRGPPRLPCRERQRLSCRSHRSGHARSRWLGERERQATTRVFPRRLEPASAHPVGPRDPVHLARRFVRSLPRRARRQPRYEHPADALWNVWLLLFSGPEDAPKSRLGRLLAMFLVLVGVAMVGFATAIVTSYMVESFLRRRLVNEFEMEEHLILCNWPRAAWNGFAKSIARSFKIKSIGRHHP